MNKIKERENKGSEAHHQLRKPYVIQNVDFVQMISLSEWVEKNLKPEPTTWVQMEVLYNNYTSWMVNHPEWEEKAIVGRIAFSKRLKLIASAKGWAFSTKRIRGVRGALGVALEHSSAPF